MNKLPSELPSGIPVRPSAYEDLRLSKCIAALKTGRRIHVTTSTRDEWGHIFEVGRSPYHNDFRARLVDDSGKVHYFRPLRSDCSVELA